VRQGVESFDFHAIYSALHNFCAGDLSAFYFDVRKDSLYCDRPDDERRRAARTVLDLVFDALVRWLAPILCFTCEEAWLSRHGEAAGSVHLQQFPELPAAWRDEALAGRWDAIRNLRRVATGAIELERAAKRIGSSLQAAVRLHVPPEQAALLDGLDLAEISIVSDASMTTEPPPDGAFTLPDLPGVAAVVTAAPGEKCQRCWRVLPEVAEELCLRCTDAVHHLTAAA